MYHSVKQLTLTDLFIFFTFQCIQLILGTVTFMLFHVSYQQVSCGGRAAREQN